MKKRSILERQSVKRRNLHEASRLWAGVRLVTSLSFKVSLLLIGIIALSLLFLYLYQYLVTSPYVKLEEVVFTGVDEDIKQELIKMSGLSGDLCLLSIDLNEIKRSMESHPWIRSVELEKRFPHTLFIRAEKEVPVAVVALDGLSYMNRWGEIFKKVEQKDDKDFPVITGISKNNGRTLEQLKLAAGVLEAFKTEKGDWSIKEIGEIHVCQDGDIYLYPVNLPTVIKMGGRELDIQKRELKKVVEHLRKTGRELSVKAIDLNYPDGVVVSFKKG